MLLSATARTRSMKIAAKATKPKSEGPRNRAMMAKTTKLAMFEEPRPITTHIDPAMNCRFNFMH
jgi:hypothetical protein